MNLVVTKYRLPPMRPHQVARARLLNRLVAGLDRKLTLIAAPAGFGKSSLAVELAHRSGRRAAWLSLDPTDSDPARWAAYLTAALREVGVEVTEEPSPEALVASLINGVATGGPLLLVFDDYHLIQSAEIEAAVGLMLDRLPPNLHLVITARSRPSLPLARMKVRGELTEVTAAELRFTAPEATAFLHGAMGLALRSSEVEALVAKTEGWAAGIQLAALSLQGTADAAAAIEGFNGRNPDLLDYLVDEVIQSQTPSVQEFLLRTAVLERLTGPLCEAVTGEPDGQRTLLALEGANLFLMPLDPERRWYRYHALFAEFLRARLQEQVGEAGVAELHRRAALWYRAEVQFIEAVDHLLKAGAHAEAADWLDEGLAEWAGRHSPQTLRRWVERLPEACLGPRPRLAIMAAWALITTGAVQAEQQFAQTVEYLNLAARALRAPGRPGDSSQALDDPSKAPALGLLAAVRTALAPWAPLRQLPVCMMEDLAYAVRFGQEARRLLPAEALFWRSVVNNSLGAVYLRSGNVASAAQAFGEAARLGTESGDLTAAVAALRQQGDLLLLLGKLHAAEAVYQDGLRVAGEQAVPGLAAVYLGLGRIRYEWNDLTGAEGSIREALRRYEAMGSAAPEALFALARVKQAAGDPGAARALVAQGGALLGSAPKLRAVAAERWPEGVGVLLSLGEVAEARRWVQAAGVGLDRSPLLWRAPEYLALARVLVAEGEGDAALPLLASLRAVARASGCRGIEAETWVVEGLALGDGAQARSALQGALGLTAAEGYIRLYSDRSVLGLLTQIAAEWRRGRRAEAPHLGYLERLLAMLGEERPAQVEGLTEREAQILRLLAAGGSNQAVADSLFMGVSTVKWHLINIYGKLQAKNRTEAVARARSMGLV